jgi:hypothetical protein
VVLYSRLEGERGEENEERAILQTKRLSHVDACASLGRWGIEGDSR